MLPAGVAYPRKRRSMGPFETPWATFLAWIVIAGTVVLAVLWSVFRTGKDEER
jgi:hypothetical protein